MSTTARRYWLKALRRIGVKQFRATSGLGLPYICHVGDFAGEVPFYGRGHSVEEILLMAAWCRNTESPVIFDVGANNGFIATQLAQLLSNQCPRIFAFEPVPSTFAQLKLSIEQLDLQRSVTPVCCAVSNDARIARISYNPRESLFAQIEEDGHNPRVGSKSSFVATITIDQVTDSLRITPSLIKLDVEGYERRVLQGALRLLSSDNAPAICLEWNPLTMGEAGTSPAELINSLPNYDFYYINDFEGQKLPLAKQLMKPIAIDWVCNIFAFRSGEPWQKWWRAAVSQLKIFQESLGVIMQ